MRYPGGEGGGPRGLTPKIKIVDLDILFPYLRNRILNFSIVFELFAFVHFGVREKPVTFNLLFGLYEKILDKMAKMRVDSKYDFCPLSFKTKFIFLG